MDPSSGKLFGAIGSAAPGEAAAAFLPESADPDFSRWYTLQWLKCQGFGDEPAARDDSQCDTL